MKLVFLGTGSSLSPTKDNYHANMIVDNGAGKRLLIDCGSDARFSLFEQGYSYKDVNAVYISHLHADHVGGLEWLAFSTYFDPDCPKPTLFISETLVSDLWHKVLAGGLSSLADIEANLATYFNIVAIPENNTFEWESITFELVQTVHVMNGFCLAPSFGLFFRIGKHHLFITTDTQLTLNSLEKFYKRADFIFHDCEILPHKTGVHAHYSELLTLNPDYKKKMWLYHYQPIALPNAKKDGFQGFVLKGQTFTFTPDQ